MITLLWKQECKQLLRTPLRTFVFCLALAVVMGLLSITIGLLVATQSAVDMVEDGYTTVGTVPRVMSTQYASKDEYTAARERAVRFANLLINDRITLENVKIVNRHSWLLAYDPLITPLTSATSSDEEYSFDLNMPQNLALFAVTCTEAVLQKEVPSAAAVGGIKRIYSYSFDVNEAAVIHPDFNMPKQLTLTSDLYFEIADMIFEVGHSYWVWGYYDALSETSGILTLHPSITGTTSNSRGEIKEGTLQIDRWEKERILYINQPFSAKMMYSLPVIGEYTGSDIEYLEADEAEMWRELIEVLTISMNSLRVCSANYIEGLHPFVHGNCRVIEGTAFSEEDIVEGRKVALISDVLSQKNNLQIGDTLDLSFYDTDWSVSSVGFSYSVEIGMLKPTKFYGASNNQYEELLKGQDEKPVWGNDAFFTVVGIYSTSGWIDDYRVMHPNTVIVPQSTLMQAYYSVTQPDMNMSLIIPNGGIEKVEEELATYGYEELLEYYDGGYSVIMPNVVSIDESVVFVNNIVLGLWVIVVIAVLTMLVLMQIPAGRVKYRLGAGKRAICGQMMFATLLTVLVSGVGGCVGSILFYDRALNGMMQSDFTSFNTAFSSGSANGEMLEQILSMLGQEAQFFVLVSAVQVGILSILGAVICAIVSLRKTGFGQ